VKRPNADANEGTTPAISDTEARRLVEALTEETLEGPASCERSLTSGVRPERIGRRSLHDWPARYSSPEIGLLTALQTLNLDGCRLTTLPPEIGSLKALQTLNLDGWMRTNRRLTESTLSPWT
jgi:Leucine-rich repeat (LRR) protein